MWPRPHVDVARRAQSAQVFGIVGSIALPLEYKAVEAVILEISPYGSRLPGSLPVEFADAVSLHRPLAYAARRRQLTVGQSFKCSEGYAGKSLLLGGGV